MSMIKSKDTKPEQIVRKYLFAQGLRYRKNVRTLIGKPDIVLKKYHTVIFVNGCFWHAHQGCQYFVMPKSNVEFWKAKIDANLARDREVYNSLTRLGWNVIVVWECELRKNRRDTTLRNLFKNITTHVS